MKIGYCRSCWGSPNPQDEEAVERWKRWHYVYHLTRKFSISWEEAEQLGEIDSCQCCGTSFGDLSGRSRRQQVHIDHDHATGKIRGAVCRRCNIAIGYLESSGPGFEAAIFAYLKR
jgi:hypothetical protein